MGISRCYGGVGVGHTREIERIKEKMNIAKEESMGTKTVKGQFIRTRQRGSGSRNKGTRRPRL